MYVCMCNGVTNKEIDQSLHNGSKTVSDITHATGAGGCCGSCVPMLEQMVEDHRQQHLGVMNIDLAIALVPSAPMADGVGSCGRICATCATPCANVGPAAVVNTNLTDTPVLDTARVRLRREQEQARAPAGAGVLARAAAP